jgi:ATP-binding cassette, subfamily C (CFTR/MRP), member 4
MLLRAFGLKILFAGFYYMFCELITRTFQPIFLSNLLKYFSDVEAAITKPQAYFYATALFLCALVPVINYHHYIIFISLKFLKLKVGCTSLIHEKVIWLTQTIVIIISKELF